MLVQSRESIREELEQCLDVLKEYRIKFPDRIRDIDKIENELIELCDNDNSYEIYQTNPAEYVYDCFVFQEFHLVQDLEEDDFQALNETFKMYDFNCPRRIKNLIYLYLNTECELLQLPVQISILEILTMYLYIEPFVEFSTKAMHSAGPKGTLEFTREQEIRMLRERHTKKISESMFAAINEGEFETGRLTLKFSDFQISRTIPVAMLVDSFFIRRGFDDILDFTIEMEGEMTDSLVSVFFSYICRGDVEKEVMKLDKEEKERLQIMADQYQLIALCEIIEAVNLLSSGDVKLPLEGIERENIHVVDNVYVIKVTDTINRRVGHFWSRKVGNEYKVKSLNVYLYVGDLFSDIEIEPYFENPASKSKVQKTEIYENIANFEVDHEKGPFGFYNMDIPKKAVRSRRSHNIDSEDDDESGSEPDDSGPGEDEESSDDEESDSD